MAFQRQFMGNTTEAHQMASTVLFTSPIRCLGGRPEDYLTHPAKELFMNVPCVWDETVVLPYSVLGESAVMARRSGKDWYVAGYTVDGQTFDIALDFLDSSTYEATLAKDVQDGASELLTRSVVANDLLSIPCATGGGFLLRLIPQ